MSSQVLSYGYFAKLITPIGDYETEEYEILTEHLYDNGSHLHINYEGTLIYSDNLEHGDFYCGLYFLEDISKENFIQKCKDNNFKVVENRIKPYVCSWYNGADSDMSMMKLEDFINDQ